MSNKGRERGKALLSVLITTIIIVLLLARVSDIVRLKTSYYNNAPFFEYADDYDVIFLGSSHMEVGVMPMQLWRDYGITSYNLGSSACGMAQSYWVLKNALDYASPKVVVVDCCFLMSDIKLRQMGLAHRSFDCFPISYNKVLAVRDLILDDNGTKTLAEKGEVRDIAERKPISLLWDFSVYHDRWDELTEEDFAPECTKEFGACTEYGICPNASPIVDRLEHLDNDTEEMIYLEKIIQLCEDNGISTVLTYIPYFGMEKNNWACVNTACDISKEYGIPYYNFFDIDIINYKIDQYDDVHLNVNGAAKITDYIGTELTNSSYVEDHRNDPNYKYWDDCYAEYKQMRVEQLFQTESIYEYLLLLQDDEFEYAIKADDVAFLQDDTIYEILKEKGVLCDNNTQLFEGNIIMSPGLSNVSIEGIENYENSIVIRVFDADDSRVVYDTAFFDPQVNYVHQRM